MARIVVGVVAAGIVLLAAVSPSLAQPAESRDDRIDRALRECMEQQTEGVYLGPPTCRVDSEGNLISRTYGDGSAVGSMFGTFFVLWLLWSAIPLAIAAAMASSRGESVGIAILLTLFLGWIGLAIVYFGQERTRTSASRVLQPSPAAPGPQDAASRLRHIDHLWSEGLISDAERAQRRQAVLDQL